MAGNFRARLDKLSLQVTNNYRGAIADRPVSDDELEGLLSENRLLSRNGILRVICTEPMTESEWIASVNLQ